MQSEEVVFNTGRHFSLSNSKTSIWRSERTNEWTHEQTSIWRTRSERTNEGVNERTKERRNTVEALVSNTSQGSVPNISEPKHSDVPNFWNLTASGFWHHNEGDIGDLRYCGVSHFFKRPCGEKKKKNPSLQCCGDLKPYGVRCLHFKVYGVRWNEIICGIPVSIIFGQMTSRKRSCTSEAAVTFRRSFAAIFIDLPMAKFKRKLRDPKTSVE